MSARSNALAASTLRPPRPFNTLRLELLLYSKVDLALGEGFAPSHSEVDSQHPQARFRPETKAVAEQPFPLILGTLREPPVEGGGIDEQVHQHSLKKLDDLASTFPDSVEVNCVHRSGSAIDEILAVANDQAVDLIIIASHDYSESRHVLIGSVAFLAQWIAAGFRDWGAFFLSLVAFVVSGVGLAITLELLGPETRELLPNLWPVLLILGGLMALLRGLFSRRSQ